jgi:GAF domain-containing protein
MREKDLSPERELAEVFVELADTLVTDFDVIEFLHRLTERCVRLLGVEAAGILLTDQADALQLVAASSEQSRLLELFQLQSEQGPCLEAFAAGTPVICPDLAAEAHRWPVFAPAALAAGFAAVHALPMRLRTQVIGALNLFSAVPGGLAEGTARIGQALADVATIGLIGERATRAQDLLTEQLQLALNSRVVIEQAKGMLAERHTISVDEAFGVMRAYARRNNHKLTDVAHAVIDGDPAIAEMTVPKG